MEGEFEKSNVVSGSGGAWAELIDVEPFVDPDAVAQFLSVKRKTVLDWASNPLLLPQ
jgi:hypothetical protein